MWAIIYELPLLNTGMPILYSKNANLNRLRPQFMVPVNLIMGQNT